jgi:hypothetical protein
MPYIRAKALAGFVVYYLGDIDLVVDHPNRITSHSPYRPSKPPPKKPF